MGAGEPGTSRSSVAGPILPRLPHRGSVRHLEGRAARGLTVRPRCFVISSASRSDGKLIAEMPEIDTEKEPQNGLHWLMTEEVQGLVEACRKSRNTTLADLVEFALFTGVRMASRGLTSGDVNRACGVIGPEIETAQASLT